MLKKLLRYVGIAATAIILLLMALCIVWYRSDIEVGELEEKYFTTSSSYLNVDGEAIHIKQQGHGPVLFLLHGSFASLHTWNEWDNLLRNDFRTISLDFPGHGLTGPTRTEYYSTDDYEKLVFQIADKLSIDTFYVAGNSMGGLVAWKMALHRPNRIRKLILLDAAGYSTIEKGKQAVNQQRPLIFTLLQNDLIASALVKITPRFLFDWNLRQVYGNPKKVKSTDVDRFYDLMLRKGNRLATVKRLRQTSLDLQDSISTIKVPTLIIWGEDDRWIPVSSAVRFNEEIRDSKLEILQGVGHIPMEEEPIETAEIVKNFSHKKP